ncbi:MAG TPA: NAD(P)-dependent alcohol dehydrogenase, partial [Nitrososphaerales archaeon]|nr:NAD(P)-dependent alcohol dehydrogenase [Nitrososphaerales archaeon]
MRAIVCPRYGPPEVLQLVEIEKPVPKEQEVLVHVHAATVMAGDCELRGLKGSPMWQILLRLGFGIRSPRRKVLGQDLAGKVEAVGAGVTKFKAGDQVFGNTGLRLGAYADYCCLGQDGPIATKPANMTYDEAATIPSAVIYTFPLLEKVNIKEGQSVLVIGAGGTMGSMVVQFAKASGADVTGVDSTSKVEMVRSIGADKTVD